MGKLKKLLAYMLVIALMVQSGIDLQKPIKVSAASSAVTTAVTNSDIKSCGARNWEQTDRTTTAGGPVSLPVWRCRECNYAVTTEYGNYISYPCPGSYAKINLDAAGGNCETTEVWCPIGSQYSNASEFSNIKLPTPTRNGYTFLGWEHILDVTDAHNNPRVDIVTEASPSWFVSYTYSSSSLEDYQAITLTAVWVANTSTTTCGGNISDWVLVKDYYWEQSFSFAVYRHRTWQAFCTKCHCYFTLDNDTYNGGSSYSYTIKETLDGPVISTLNGTGLDPDYPRSFPHTCPNLVIDSGDSNNYHYSVKYNANGGYLLTSPKFHFSVQANSYPSTYFLISFLFKLKT